MSTPSKNQSSDRTLKAQRLEIVDKHGKLKIMLDGATNGPVVRLWGSDGTLKASLGILKTDQPALMFWEGLVPMMDLRLQEDGAASLGLINTQTRKGVAMLTETLGRAHLEMQKTTAAVSTPKKARKKKDVH
jgi:hypothetical protein